MQMNLASSLLFPIETQTKTLHKLSHIIHLLVGRNSLWLRKVEAEVNQNNKLLSYLLLH